MTASRPGAEIRRRFSATPEQVFAAFADARLVSRWLKPAPEIALTVLQFEFRVGGSYRFAYDPPDQQTVVVFGSYRAIEPPSRLAFSWTIEPPDIHAGIESEVTVTITPLAGGAELVIRHEKLGPADAVLRHDQGWRGALDHLSALLEGGNDP
jgi:uncharacterized protein YndB with AHSA1/START domain